MSARIRPEPVRLLLRGLGSLRLTLAGMLALGAAALASYRQEELPAIWIAAALAVLALNLIAALVDRPQFRRQSGLLVFHLCLLAIIVLAAAGTMTRMKGRVELVEGQRFDPASVVIVREGPWHRRRLDRVAFAQGGIEVEYAPGVTRGRTRSEVLPVDPDHVPGAAAPDVERPPIPTWIGDTRSMLLAGYRFITTSNKGHAVLLTWQADAAPALTGALHLPAFPMFEWNQRKRWTSPQGLELELEFELPPAPHDRSWTLRSGSEHRLLLRVVGRGESAREVALMPGQSVSLDGGVLRYEGSRLWMGYRIEFDPVLPWLFTAAMIGVAGLGWHFWRKLWAVPLPADSEVVTTRSSA